MGSRVAGHQRVRAGGALCALAQASASASGRGGAGTSASELGMGFWGAATHIYPLVTTSLSRGCSGCLKLISRSPNPIHPGLSAQAPCPPSALCGRRPLPPPPASAGGSAFLRGREPGLDWEGGGACSEAAQLWWRVASPGGVELSRLGHTTPPGAPPWHPVPTADPELPDRCHRSRGPAPGEDQQCRAGACQAAGLPAVGSGPGAGPAGVCLPPQLCPADPQTGRWEGSATACLCEGPGGRGHTVCPRKAATGAHEEGSCVPVKLLSQRRAGAGPVPAATGRPSAPSPASCLR